MCPPTHGQLSGHTPEHERPITSPLQQPASGPLHHTLIHTHAHTHTLICLFEEGRNQKDLAAATHTHTHTHTPLTFSLAAVPQNTMDARSKAMEASSSEMKPPAARNWRTEQVREWALQRWRATHAQPPTPPTLSGRYAPCDRHCPRTTHPSLPPPSTHKSNPHPSFRQPATHLGRSACRACGRPCPCTRAPRCRPTGAPRTYWCGGACMCVCVCVCVCVCMYVCVRACMLRARLGLRGAWLGLCGWGCVVGVGACLGLRAGCV